ncbi:TlpA disulfide reductase family protein [Haloflavibacter putidus]|uniref:TlpA family protein disulfide reductase n=1 Tax=Haloflavibacter putidus TaxID=2576776 RepID=A0A507ZQL6_9FLAO|nr:TlpA disulfide reductase family protein [Haloflavibacter putidus]TQD38823.1 TlpA family protein disulfide reductase [Haloflavibacter putidus]
MQKSTFLLLAGSLFFVFACQDDQKERQSESKQIGNLHLKEAKPQPGKNLALRYNNDASTVEAAYYYMKDGKTYAEDLSLKDSANTWVANFKVPDSAKAIAFRFKVADSVDNNAAKGYTTALYNEKGEILPGSNANLGMYYQGLGANQKLEISKDSSMALIEKDLKENPDLQKDWDARYLQFLQQNKPEKAEAYAQSRMASYENDKDLNEEETQNLMRMYAITGQQKKADSLQTALISNFPKGEMAQRTLIQQAFSAPDVEAKVKVLEDYDKKVDNPEIERDFILRAIASSYQEQGNYEKMQEYAQQIQHKGIKSQVYNSAAWQMAEKGENLEMAAKLSKESLEIIKKEQEEQNDRREILTAKEYKENLDNSWGMYADTYAFILHKQGKLDKAISYQEKATKKMEDAEMNERLIQFLVEAEKYEKAANAAADFVKTNQATKKVKDWYLEAKQNLNNSKEEAEKELAALEEEANETLKSELKKEMLSKTAADFNLQDLEGKQVSLQDLKGKTVILDFWATWCGPCLASFPGMKNAVEEYKDNDNVEFIFVNTLENGTMEQRKERVSSFLKEKDYPFWVVMDKPVKEKSRSFKTAQDYGIEGIPTKIILGPDNKIKFKKVGYSGNNDKLLKEIEMMVELIEEESKS